MKYIKTMLFVLLASIATSPLFAADIAGGYIGIQASVNGVEIDGDHNDSQGNVTTGTIGKFAVIGGAELGYVYPMGDNFLLDVGMNLSSGDAKITSGSTNNTDVSFAVADLVQFYIAPTVALSDMSSVYLKVGYAMADATAEGDVTKPDNLHGEVVAIGTRTVMPNGFFIRSEAGFADFDKIEVKGKTAPVGGQGEQSGISNTTTVSADPKVAFGSLSLGYKF